MHSSHWDILIYQIQWYSDIALAGYDPVCLEHPMEFISYPACHRRTRCLAPESVYSLGCCDGDNNPRDDACVTLNPTWPSG
jgi:hypothetical protein